VTHLTPEAKARLSATVRDLRAKLTKQLGDELESAYRRTESAEVLPEDSRRRRRRLEEWAAEQARGGARGLKEPLKEARERHIQGAVKLAAATLLNRFVVLRQMEALGLSRVPVVTGGWNSAGYQDFREFAPALLKDAGEGYPYLLDLVFAERAQEMPGLFGDGGITSLIPVPTPAIRAVVEALDDPDLESAWRDDTTLGWVYQFWNDPEREALDEKIRTKGPDGKPQKIENHEIAAKTQLFTDRYMVEWLLQNSLGQLWFAICQKNGWTPEVVSSGLLDRLEARRAEWRGMRDRGEVDLEALMPLPGAQSPDLHDLEVEDRWKYWVPRELPADSAEHAPSTLRDLKLLDPACGSGHFLVIAFDLLAALYEEEARHRALGGEAADPMVSWTRKEIAESILERNLHGIDLDPRAVHIAGAALWLKLKTWAPEAEPLQVNLVASNLGLGSLPADDPALLELESALEREVGLPPRLTRRLVEALKGADYLGSLLKVDEAIDRALEEHESGRGGNGKSVGVGQGNLFRGFPPEQLRLDGERARRSVSQRLGEFLARHTASDQIGLRLRGEQLAAGVRFVRMVKEGQYHLVVGNPPYMGGGSWANSDYVARHYPLGKADLYAAFLVRGLQLACTGGFSSLLTLRGWMFLGQFQNLREWLLTENDLRLLGDLDRGGFELVLDEVVAVAISLIRKAPPSTLPAISQLPTARNDRSRDSRRTARKRAALLAGVGRHVFHPAHLQAVDGWPLIYWWDEAFLARYAGTEKLGNLSAARQGMATADNTRFLRSPWEVSSEQVFLRRGEESLAPPVRTAWVPYVKGAAGRAWFETVSDVLRWDPQGLEVKTLEIGGRQASRPQNEAYYFRPGVAFSMIGASFTARLHRFRSVFGHKGSSVFPEEPAQAVCLMNSSLARYVLESLNPGVGFEVGDVNRLPLFPIQSADEIVARLDEAFTEHEAHRETSVEFRSPGPSCWTWAQDWAQRAVDRPEGQPLPPWSPVHEDEPPVDHVSFAFGVAMGRFGALAEGDSRRHPDGAEGILDRAPEDALPGGILYLSAATGQDSLDHPATELLQDAWRLHGPAVAPRKDLREWLRGKFFPDDHLKRYEKRPIHLPLSSARRTFVAWISIHRWQDDTLQTLLADHLNPERARLEAELADLGETRSAGDARSQARAQRRYDEVQAWLVELYDFMATVEQIAERGAPPSDPRCQPREADAPFRMDLDDGVMINAAALWPLLAPQGWKDPARWWAQLCNAGSPSPGGLGGKDYDWSHLAERYFPRRVDDKCRQDPSLAVAHGRFWRYHPEKAWQWELRLQSPDELGPDFRLEEPGSPTFRAAFDRDHPDQVRDLRLAEDKRRARKAAQDPSEELLDFEEDSGDD